MPYPAGTFINQIVDPAVRAEFESLYSLFQGYLSQQHKDTGAHGAVTADSVAVTGAVTGEAGAMFDGNVTAQADTNAVIAGHLPEIGSIRAIDGVDMRTLNVGSVVSRWRIGTFNSAGSAGELIVSDVKRALGPYTFRLYWNGFNYALDPEAASPVQLGTNSTGTRLLDVCASDMHALNGYHERSRTAAMGEWTAVAFNAADYQCSGGGTWALISTDVITLKWEITGKRLTVTFDIVSSNVVGGGTLSFPIPGGFTANSRVTIPIRANNAGTFSTGIAQAASGGTVISFFSDVSASGFAATIGSNTGVQGQIVIEVQ